MDITITEWLSPSEMTPINSTCVFLSIPFNGASSPFSWSTTQFGIGRNSGIILPHTLSYLPLILPIEPYGVPSHVHHTDSLFIANEYYPCCATFGKSKQRPARCVTRTACQAPCASPRSTTGVTSSQERRGHQEGLRSRSRRRRRGR